VAISAPQRKSGTAPRRNFHEEAEGDEEEEATEEEEEEAHDHTSLSERTQSLHGT